MTDEIGDYGKQIVDEYRVSITPLVGEGEFREVLVDKLSQALSLHNQTLLGKLDEVVSAFESYKGRESMNPEDSDKEEIDYQSFPEGTDPQLIFRIRRRLNSQGITTYSQLLKRINQVDYPYKSLGIETLGRKCCGIIMAHVVEKGLYEPRD